MSKIKEIPREDLLKLLQMTIKKSIKESRSK